LVGNPAATFCAEGCLETGATGQAPPRTHQTGEPARRSEACSHAGTSAVLWAEGPIRDPAPDAVAGLTRRVFANSFGVQPIMFSAHPDPPRGGKLLWVPGPGAPIINGSRPRAAQLALAIGSRCVIAGLQRLSIFLWRKQKKAPVGGRAALARHTFGGHGCISDN